MTKNNQNLITTIIALSLLLSVSLGCRAITERLKENAQGTNTSGNQDGPTSIGNTQPGSSSSAQGDLTEKANLYISKCVNTYSSSVMSSYQRYTSWLKDKNAGPTGRETLVYGLYEVRGDGTDCETAVREANEAAPDIPTAEQSADKYVIALKEAAKQIQSVYAYYDQEDYKDDGFAKGKASHAALIAAFEAFDTANKDFSLEVDKIEDEVAANRLEEYRDDPSKKFAFAVTDFNIKAKKALVYASRTEYSSLSADTLQTHVDQLEPAITEMKNAGTDKSMSSSYMDGGEKFVKAVKELMRRVRDKKPFNSTEASWLGTGAGWMVEGSPDKVVHEYNSLIRSRSFLRL
jgi:hypothetical protein